MELSVKGRRGKENSKKWLNTIEDMRTAGVCVEDVGDWAKWRFRTKVADPK